MVEEKNFYCDFCGDQLHVNHQMNIDNKLLTLVKNDKLFVSDSRNFVHFCSEHFPDKVKRLFKEDNKNKNLAIKYDSEKEIKYILDDSSAGPSDDIFIKRDEIPEEIFSFLQKIPEKVTRI